MTKFIPFHTLPMSSLDRFRLVAWPPKDDSPGVAEDCGDLVIDAIVFKSGRRQTLGVPAADVDESAPGTAVVETE